MCMRTPEFLAVCLLAALMSACSGARYQAPEPRYQMDTGGATFEREKQWREQAVRFPDFPGDGSLEQFMVKGGTENRFFVDSRSLSVDPDGVVRYALIVRSAAGAETVAYEGIRCETREWKPYAFGRSDQTWSPARDPNWQRIEWRSTNAYRFALYRDYFCPDGYPLRNTGEALAALRRQGPDKDRNR
jgi:hypothetical protein